MIFSIFAFSGFLFGSEISSLVKVKDDIWKTNPPNKIVGFGSYDNALTYVNILNNYSKLQKTQKNVNGVQFEWYAGEKAKPSGGFFLHNGLRSFIAANNESLLLANYKSVLKSFEEGYGKADFSGSEDRYQKARKILQWPQNCATPTQEVTFNDGQKHKIVTEDCMAALVEQTLGLTSTVTCVRTLNKVGEESSETIAIYTIKQNDKPLYVVKQYPQDKTWSEKKFDFFKKAFTHRTEPISITNTPLQVSFYLPIGLWNVGDIYLEVLNMAPGKSVAAVLQGLGNQERLQRQIWALLGKALGKMHQKIGKFCQQPSDSIVPQLDYQLKNIFLDDSMNVALIDLDSLGKDPIKGLDNIIQQEVLIITKKLVKQWDGAYSEQDIPSEYTRLYINGYLSTFSEDLQHMLRVAIAKVRQIQQNSKLSEEERQQQQIAADAALARQLATEDWQGQEDVSVGGEDQRFQALVTATCQRIFVETQAKAHAGVITKTDNDYMLRRAKEPGDDVTDRDLDIAGRLIAADEELAKAITAEKPTRVPEATTLLVKNFGEKRGPKILNQLFLIES